MGRIKYGIDGAENVWEHFRPFVCDVQAAISILSIFAVSIIQQSTPDHLLDSKRTDGNGECDDLEAATEDFLYAKEKKLFFISKSELMKYYRGKVAELVELRKLYG